ncbi:glucose 1-dehydrogenase [Microbacterium sp. YY-01]|uniref:glucose 1-dehydrogenase n=1 Tax=Microbacterium sp. YY-01 TaxID=3421634 RepID=UPI003D183205
MNSLFDITGRLALVTGSSRGIGQTFARVLAEAGARVILHGRDQQALQVAQEQIQAVSQHPVAVIRCDVTDATQTARVLGDTVAEHGVPDILVNNAGLQRRAPIQDFAADDWDLIVASNLSSAFYVSRPLLPGMVERGSGKIINIASVQSHLARQTIAPYSATKGGVAQLTKGMAADLARHGVQVNALSPGYFATEMNTALVDDPEFSAWVAQRTPAGRWGSLDELAGALLFLASDASSFVSGQNLFVDGGMTAVV